MFSYMYHLHEVKEFKKDLKVKDLPSKASAPSSSYPGNGCDNHTSVIAHHLTDFYI